MRTMLFGRGVFAVCVLLAGLFGAAMVRGQAPAPPSPYAPVAAAAPAEPRLLPVAVGAPAPTPLPLPADTPRSIVTPACPAAPTPAMPAEIDPLRRAVGGPVTDLSFTPFFEGEYLLWWVRDRALPPLVTTSAAQASLGVLDQPDTRVLYGGNVGGQTRSGGRFTLGVDWALRDACGHPDSQGTVEAVFFFLGRQDNGFNASSDGTPVLARPFFNVVTGTQFSEQVANLQVGTIPPGPGPRPGFARAFIGSIAVDNPSRVYGGELNVTLDSMFIRDGTEDGWLQGLVGFRYLGLVESLTVRENLTLPATAAAGVVLLPETAIQITDQFRTNNHFYGPQLGFKTGYRIGVVSMRLAGKVALGWMNQQVEIDGSNTNTVRDIATGQLLPPTTTASGLLAQPTNIGRFERTRFAVVPEGTVDLGWNVLANLRLSVGYNFLYASSVVRPGDVIDLNVDPRFRSGGAAPTDATRPALVFRNSDLWLQGLTFGMDLRY